MPLQCKDYEDYVKHLEMEHVTTGLFVDAPAKK